MTRTLRRAGENGADRPGDVGGRERCRRHLIEQRLEHVVIAPVHERHVDVAAGKPLRSCEPAEAGADDHDMGAVSLPS